MHHPCAGDAAVARPAMAEQRRALRQVLGLDEQLSECRMGDIVSGRTEYHFGVAGHVDLADPQAVIGQGEAPDFHVVFGGDSDVELRGDVIVPPREGRLLGQEYGGVPLALHACRVIRRRPDRPAAYIAQVHELAAVVAGGIVARPRHRDAVTGARPAAGIGDGGDVSSVRQKLGMRKRRVRRSISPQRNGRGRRRNPHLVERPRLRRRDAPWHALLQEQLGGLHARIGVETFDHAVAEQRIGERHQRHALVVGEARGHDDAVPASISRRRLSTLRAGSNAVARAVAYGATTCSSPRPRLSPRPGTPNALY